tara:strand:+ start:7602 stop:7997 length:396 start_codon:yes stop_codon:yes gene_type:complete
MREIPVIEISPPTKQMRKDYRSAGRYYPKIVDAFGRITQRVLGWDDEEFGAVNMRDVNAMREELFDLGKLVDFEKFRDSDMVFYFEFEALSGAETVLRMMLLRKERELRIEKRVRKKRRLNLMPVKYGFLD